MEHPKKMARKKSDPENLPPRQTVVTIKGTPEWKEWLDGATVHCRDSIVGLIDKAIADYVKAHGYDVPPPPR